MRIDPSIELERIGLPYDRRESSLRVTCPFHVDDTPSCDVYLDNAAFRCHGCGAAGSLAGLIARVTGRPQHVVQSELEARYGVDEKPIDVDQVERFHLALWSNERLLKELRARAVGDDSIRKFRLGCDRDRITIPIPNPAGEWVNLRRYAPGAERGPKFTNSKGRGGVLRLYPFQQLRYKKLVLCGGEVKAIAVAQALNQHGIGAVALSGGGESNWSAPLEAFFDKKIVWICPDIDTVGLEWGEFRAARLSGIAEWIGLIDLPLDKENHPHGDVNDYLAKCTPADLLRLLESTPEYKTTFSSPPRYDQNEDPTEVSVVQINSSEFVNRRIRCHAMVSAIDQEIYYIPKEVNVKCTRDQDMCQGCPIFLAKSDEVFTIHPESPTILAIAATHKMRLRDEILEGLGVPKSCPVAEPDVKSSYKIVETRIQKTLDLRENTSDKIMLPAVVVDSEVDLNESYEMTGKPVPHPKTQAATILVSKAEAVEDALSTFQPGDTDDLLIFRPEEWTVDSIEEQLDAIYEFYELNVTRIYDRIRMHKFIDLVFHSVLSMNIENRPTKGWLELLIIGDSSQGKSESVSRLCDYYGLGVRVDCKNATTAGLLGGLEDIGGKFFAQWGVIPTHDRRLVVLEELKGLKHEVFSSLTDMRSSGRAVMSKIKRGQAHARTRLIAITNAQGSQTMNSYGHGVRAIGEVVLNPEDVRRFDSCVVLNKEDIDPNVINTRRREIEEPFTRESARRLVLWSWTRRMDQVLIQHEAYDTALRLTKALCETYSETIPLVDRGDTRHKLLRFACAVAARTFSTDDSRSGLVVRSCHVEYADKLLREEYESPSNGYGEFSRHDKHSRTYIDEKKVIQEISRSPFPMLLVQRLMINQDMEMQDFQDWNGWSSDEARMFASVMVRANALKRDKRFYKKMPGVIPILKRILESPSIVDRPEHIQEGTY